MKRFDNPTPLKSMFIVLRALDKKVKYVIILLFLYSFGGWLSRDFLWFRVEWKIRERGQFRCIRRRSTYGWPRWADGRQGWCGLCWLVFTTCKHKCSAIYAFNYSGWMKWKNPTIEIAKTLVTSFQKQNGYMK